MFAFSETEQALAETLRQFCDREIEALVPALESGAVSPFEVMQRLADTFQLEQMIAPALRRQAVGRNTSDRADDDSAQQPGGRPGVLGEPGLAAVFAKELARVSPGLCLCVTASMGCGATIAARGDAELRERLALPLLTLRKVGCWALTEPGSGSDAFAMRTRARIERGEVVISGSKTFISNAPAADVFLIYARIDAGADLPPRADTQGASAAGREKRRIFPIVLERGMPGLSTGPAIEKMGMHASPTGDIFLDEVRVPRNHLLGDPQRPARAAAEDTLASERSAIVAMCMGVIERCLDDSIVYAMDRIQFDKPIAAFQLIQQKLAHMYVAYENVRNLMFKLIWLQKHGGGSEREVSAAKWYATEAATTVALHAVQLMGGAGYTREHAPERMFRDMKLWTIGGGTSEIQQLTIAKDLLKQRDFFIDLGGGYRDKRRGRA